MNHLDIYSGIGGFALGLRMTGGFNTVAFCEIEKHYHRILNKHWPGVPIIEDVHDITTGLIRERTGIDRIDIITAGVPCQPASVAGKQLGEEDDRWLWPETIHVIAELQPRWICLENPDGVYSVGLDGILSELESLGYANTERGGRPAISPIEIPACAVNAPIIRNRVFIVASAEDSAVKQCSKKVFTERDKEKGLHKEFVGSSNSNLDGANSSNRQEQPISIQSWEQEQASADVDGSGDGVIWDDAQYLYCQFDGEYRRVTNSESSVQRVVNGVSRPLDGLRIPLTIRVKPRSEESKEMRARLTAVGNSVNPQTIAEIGRSILAAEMAFMKDAA